MKALLKRTPPQVHGVFFLTKEQTLVMLQSFQLTAKLADDLASMPEVIEPDVPVASVAAPTPFVPASDVGIKATAANPAKAASCAPSAVTVIKPEQPEIIRMDSIKDSVQMLRLTADDNGTTTMSSLELVDFINSIRRDGSALLRHDHFMVKVPTVIGEKMAPKFLGTNKYVSGKGGERDRAVYNLPRTEAAMMAMSYSPDLMREVMNAWDAAESKLVKPTAILPTNFAEALRLAATLEEEKQAVVLAPGSALNSKRLCYANYHDYLANVSLSLATVH
jgi:hypothetical protein